MTGPYLELRHLQMILTLSETNRVSEAAERLGVTPSALSHRIREAERRLGVPLFTRTQKRLRMNPSAEYLAKVAKRILDDLSRAEDDIERMHRGVHDIVRFAVESYHSYHWLPGFLRFLRDSRPGIHLQIMHSAVSDPGRALSDRTVDLAIISGENARIDAHLTPLFDDELLFIMPPGHRLAARDYIEGPDIQGEDFITYIKVPEPDREFALLFRASGCYPRWTETVEPPEAIVELVAAGLGTSVLAGWAVQKPISDGRIASARVRKEGLSVPWYAAIRRVDAEDKSAVADVAAKLAAWCAMPGGGFKTTEG